MSKFNLKEIHDDFLNMVVDNSPLAYVIMDLDYNIVYANNFVYKVLGYDNHELVGQKCYSVVNKGTPCPNCAVRQARITGEKVTILKEEVTKDGTIRYNNLTAVPIHTEGAPLKYVMEIVQDRTAEISLQKQTEKEFYALVESFSGLIEVNNEYTGNHSKNVKDISMAIAREMNIGEQEMKELFVGAYLHDIGKIGIPESIINKDGKLTDEEMNLIRSHPVVGGNILKNIASFKNVNFIVRNHHERYDGKGYPDGLKGEETPLLARIVSAADTFDAMTTTRSYRKALPISVAREELIKFSGTQFDPMVVNALVKLIDENRLQNYNKDGLINN